ncbi:unnamed protein product [Allacma fusca]|uniref:Uncharacterized protein n=1 Tax=Allacma fusca TaxID=39272 RepID=A0A8J2L257_9HEXA|nr:unnamed protein product [Allacma fusca]
MPASLDKKNPEDSSATFAKSDIRTSTTSKKSGEDGQRSKKKSCRKKQEKPNKNICQELDANAKLIDVKTTRSKSLRGTSKGDSKQVEKSSSLPSARREAGKGGNKRVNSKGETMLGQAKRRAYSKKKRDKMKMTKKISNLVFVMPKTDDPVAKAQAASEKKVSKLVRYMKKYWKTHVDKKYYPVKVDFRMPDRMTHQRSNNWWLLKRARQKTLDHTGFFSNVREPYHDLGPPELDSAMLIFKNMHDDLLADPTKWVQDRQLKDELIRKCNAPLVRLPRARVRRPVFNKGRVKIGAGGMMDINKYVQQGYAFQNAIRGDRTYTQTLDMHMDLKENDAADLASAFGFVPRKPADTGAGDSKHDHAAKVVKSSEDTEEGEFLELQLRSLQDDRKGSHLDDRINQRVLASFENMMRAIYILIKSMINLKTSQLKSPYPLPMRVMTSLRSIETPDEKVKKKQPISALSCKSLNLNPSKQGDQDQQRRDDAEEEEANDEDEYGEDEEEEEKYIYDEDIELTDVAESILSNGDQDEEMEEEDEEETEETRSQMLLRKAKEERHLPIVAIRDPDKIASSIVETIKKTHLEKDNRGMSPEEKIINAQESPDIAYSRRKSTVDRYNKLFHGGETDKTPIWQNITLDNVFVSQAKPNVPVTKSVHHVEGENAGDEFPSATTPLPSTPKIPHVAEIHTPVLAGLESPAKIDSEDQSRLNLLAKNPEASNDNPPPSPVQFLYKIAGIKTTEKRTFESLMTIKKKFRVTEKSLRFYYANETDKADWETQNRFRHKIRALQSCPIYEKSIAVMRASENFALPEEETPSSSTIGEKRPSIWYRKLRERFEEIGARRHVGCATILANLQKYCDVDMKTKPRMTNRLCLLVVSLPTTELGTRPWQIAIKFIIDHLLGVPIELFYQWLDYRRLPPLI